MKKSIIMFALIMAGIAALFFVFMPHYTYKAETVDDMRRVIERFGWKLSDDAPQSCALTLPDPLTDVFLNYNVLLKKEGLDLLPYAGRKVMRYTFTVTNHKKGGNVYANLLLCDGKIIAADIMSPAANGFMHEINKKNYVK